MRKVVFIGVNFPEKHATAAGWRIHQIIDVMKKANDEIYFLATNEIKSEKDFENIKCINIQLNNRRTIWLASISTMSRCDKNFRH